MNLPIYIQNEDELTSLIELFGKERIFKAMAVCQKTSPLIQKYAQEYADFIHNNNLQSYRFISYIDETMNFLSEENVHKVVEFSRWEKNSSMLTNIMNYLVCHKIPAPKTLKYLHKMNLYEISTDREVVSIHDWIRENKTYKNLYSEFNAATGRYLVDLEHFFEYENLSIYHSMKQPILNFLSAFTDTQAHGRYIYVLFQSEEQFEMVKEKLIEVAKNAMNDFFESISYLKEREYGFWKITKLYHLNGYGFCVDMIKNNGDTKTIHTVLDRDEMQYKFDEDLFWHELELQF